MVVDFGVVGVEEPRHSRRVHHASGQQLGKRANLRLALRLLPDLLLFQLLVPLVKELPVRRPLLRLCGLHAMRRHPNWGRKRRAPAIWTPLKLLKRVGSLDNYRHGVLP